MKRETSTGLFWRLPALQQTPRTWQRWRKWSSCGRRCTPRWRSTAKPAAQTSRAASPSSSCACLPCAPSDSSAWSISSSSSWLGTRPSTPSWWRCWRAPHPRCSVGASSRRARPLPCPTACIGFGCPAPFGWPAGGGGRAERTGTGEGGEGREGWLWWMWAGVSVLWGRAVSLWLSGHWPGESGSVALANYWVERLHCVGLFVCF